MEMKSDVLAVVVSQQIVCTVLFDKHMLCSLAAKCDAAMPQPRRGPSTAGGKRTGLLSRGRSPSLVP